MGCSQSKAVKETVAQNAPKEKNEQIVNTGEKLATVSGSIKEPISVKENDNLTQANTTEAVQSKTLTTKVETSKAPVDIIDVEEIHTDEIPVSTKGTLDAILSPISPNIVNRSPMQSDKIYIYETNEAEEADDDDDLNLNDEIPLSPRDDPNQAAINRRNSLVDEPETDDIDEIIIPSSARRLTLENIEYNINDEYNNVLSARRNSLLDTPDGDEFFKPISRRDQQQQQQQLASPTSPTNLQIEFDAFTSSSSTSSSSNNIPFSDPVTLLPTPSFPTTTITTTTDNKTTTAISVDIIPQSTPPPPPPIQEQEFTFIDNNEVLILQPIDMVDHPDHDKYTTYTTNTEDEISTPEKYGTDIDMEVQEDIHDEIPSHYD